MRKFILLVTMLLACSSAWARDCYVSNTGNNSPNTGLTALSPYGTIGQVNGSCTTSGDMVYLDKGSSWDENLHTRTGVTYDSYGTGALPIVSRICDFTANCNSQHDYTVKNIQVTVTTNGKYAFTMRGAYNVTVDNVYVLAGGALTTSKGIFIDDGASNELTFPYNITIQNSTVIGFLQGIGARGTDIDVLNNVIYNPGTNSAGIEMTTLAENYSTTARFPNDWLVKGNRIYCNDARYNNSATGERGINVGWNAYNITVDGNYVQGCGVTTTGFGIGVDQNTGALGRNLIMNNIVMDSVANGFYTSTGSAASSDYSEGVTKDVKVYNNFFDAGTSTNATVRFLDNIAEGTAATGIEFKNNIVLTNSTTVAAISSTTEMAVDSENNSFYNTTGEAIRWTFDGSNHATIAAWRTASGQDADSLDSYPSTATIYTVGYPAPASVVIDAGLDLSGNEVTTDYRGKPRSATPTIGAYEFTQGIDIN
jgi:hypothetical protein